MLLLFAVPFTIAAGLVFTILSPIPRARRWAIPSAAGILGAEPCFMVALVGAPFLLKFLGLRRLDPAELFYLGISLAAIGGITGGFLAGTLARYFASLLPMLFLRIAVVLAGWCSYFVVICTLNFAVDREFKQNTRVFFAGTAAEGLFTLIAACLLARYSEQFRAKKIRLPYGMPFRKRGAEPPAPPVQDAP
jgi:hypothetical protein